MLQQWAIDTSGLPLPLLQHLYRKRPLAVEQGADARKRRAARLQTNAEARAFQLFGSLGGCVGVCVQVDSHEPAR